MYGCKCIEKSTENARIGENTFFRSTNSLLSSFLSPCPLSFLHSLGALQLSCDLYLSSKTADSATSLIIIYKFSNCILIGCQKTVFYSLIFHIGFARRLRPSPRFHSQHFKLIHCIFFSQAIQERYRNLTWSAAYPCELQQDDLRLYTA